MNLTPEYPYFLSPSARFRPAFSETKVFS